jgi:regulator of sigma E protease
MEWWQVLFGVLIGLVVLMVLIVVHEFGHAIAAIRNGVKVEEFAIGFRPKAWSTKLKRDFILKKGTVFSLNWLPIGGFCAMKGETDDAKAKGGYGAASLWAKTKILLAGVTFNFLLAVVIFTIMSAIGMPKIIDDQFAMPNTKVERSPVLVVALNDDSPAAAAGVSVGDTIVSLNDTSIVEAPDLSGFTKTHGGQEVSLVYQHGEETVSKPVVLNDNPGGAGNIGIAVSNSTTYRSGWSSFIVGPVTTVQFLGLTAQGLWQLLTNLFTGIAGTIAGTDAADNLAMAGDSVAGPVGILGTIFPAAMAGGFTEILLIAGLLSLSFAIMNVLPIPGLDGGRLYLTLFFRFVLRKPLKEETEGKINGIGMLILFGLMILITVLDVLRLW